MAFQMGDNDDGGMNEINLIPLIDIMLVLMIIFLVTATVMNPSISLTLPKTSADSVSNQDKKIIEISISKDNEFFIGKQTYDLAQIKTQLTTEKQQASADRLPSINIRADKDTSYDAIAKILATASETGMTDIAFVSDREQ